MTAVVEEAFYSREATVGTSASGELLYYVFDESDAEAAQLAAVLASPALFRSMPRQTSSVKRLSPSVHEVKVNYSLQQSQVQPSNPELSEFNTTLAFNLIGGTTHITTALETTSHVPAGGTVVDIRKTIGIDLKSGQVRGLDVFAPVMDFSLTTQFANAAVDQAYIDLLYDMTPCVNNAPFRGRPAGSLLFKGARGTRRGQERWELAFEFSYSKNQTNLTVGTITGINKEGWQYLETMYIEGTAKIGKHVVQVPGQVNVHTVFSAENFAQLKLGT